MMDDLPDVDDFGLVESMTDKAYRAIEEDIVTLRIQPGALVSEAVLAKRLGFGRTPIREALQRLARERLVVIMPRRGIFVSEIDPVRQLRLLEARREIERFLARSAARRATVRQRVTFREIASGMDQAAGWADDMAFMRLDLEFNALILVAAGNEFAASAMSLMNGLSRRFWYLHYKLAADLPLAARLHADIARVVADADVDAAGAGSDALIDYIQTFARSTIG